MPVASRNSLTSWKQIFPRIEWLLGAVTGEPSYPIFLKEE